MQLEKQIDGLTVMIDGVAKSEIVYSGDWDLPNVGNTYWVRLPQIIDVHRDFEDVVLTPDEEREILDNLDINDFVC